MGSQAHPSSFKPKPLVLIVEDDVFIAMILEEALVEAGFRVAGPARTVSMAMALLLVERPDVAVLDYNLLDATSTAVAKKLSALGVPFLLSSAHEDHEFDDPVFDDIENLGKPTQTAKLVAAVEALAA